MDEFILTEETGAGPGNHDVELYLATVNDITAEGATLIFDGATEATTKRFKSLRTGRGSAWAGQRVVVMKQSGTYIILGMLTGRDGYVNINKLQSNAALTTVVSRLNDLITELANKQIIVSQGTS